ncbi:hypothetical protein ACHAPU_002537 [Fusarium lateritium]
MPEPTEHICSTASRPISESNGDIDAAVATVNWRTEPLLASLNASEEFLEDSELSKKKFLSMVDVRRNVESLFCSLIRVQQHGVTTPAITYVTGAVNTIDFVFGKSSMARLLKGTDDDESSDFDSAESLLDSSA